MFSSAPNWVPGCKAVQRLARQCSGRCDTYAVDGAGQEVLHLNHVLHVFSITRKQM